jgi:predicted RecA/RadA family phage recombinase
MKNFVMHGDDIDITTPAGGLTSGVGALVGVMFGVAKLTTAQGEPNVLKTTGVIDFAKEGAGSGQAWAVGDLVYWDNTNKRLTKTSASNTKVGYAVAAALTTDVVGRARLVPIV